MTRNGPSVPNRRAFLKHAVVGAAGLASFGVGRARSRQSRLDDRRIDRAEADAAFDEHAGALFELLSERGLLDAGLDDLPTGRSVGVADVARGAAGTAYFAWTGRPDEVKTTRRVDGGTLTVSVTPETGAAQALFVPDDEDTAYLYDAERGYDGVERTAARTDVNCACEDIACDTTFGTYIKFCCEGSTCWRDGCC